MFLKSPHKFAFSSVTFALVLSVNLLFSNESIAANPEDYFNDGLRYFNSGLEEKDNSKKQKSLNDAQTLFTFAFEKFIENTVPQAESKLFWARTNALIDGPIKADPLFEEAVEHYRIAEKDALVKNGLADALFYRAENKLQIEALKKSEAVKLPMGSNSHKAKLAFAGKSHDMAKEFLEESLNLPQAPDLKIRTGGKLAYIWTEDKDNQKAKDTLLKIVNVMSDSNLRAGTQKEIIDFCLELEGKTNDANYQSAKDALVKIVDEIEDIKFKAETQKRIGEFFYVVKDLPNTISYLTKARDYFGANTAWYGYTPIDPKAVGEINIILQHVKFLTGLYNQSVIDGLAAEAWIRTSIQSSENPQDKEKFNRKLLANLHLLGSSYLKLHENNLKSGDIKNAESTFYTLNNLLIMLLKNTEETKDFSQSMFLDADSLKKLSQNSDYLDLLYNYQIKSNIGLMYTKIHQNNYADAASNLRLAEEKVKLLNGFYDKETIKKRVTRAELAVDMARLRLRMFATKDATEEVRSSNLKELVHKWSLVSYDDVAPYYAPRHLWNLETTLGDVAFHMNDIESAKAYYSAAITQARKAGYKHAEMLARNQLALMFDTNLKVEQEKLINLESELKALNTEKAMLVKEAAALKKAKSDQEESKNAEIRTKEDLIEEKEAPILTLKTMIASLTANRNRESNIADNLKLFCELRVKGYFEAKATYSEDEQNLYLTYLGEVPALKANNLNSSQLLDNYQQPNDVSLAQEVVEPDYTDLSSQDLGSTPVIVSQGQYDESSIATLIEAAQTIRLEDVPVIDYSASTIANDGGIIDSDEEQDEQTAIITEYLEEVGLQSRTPLTDDVFDLNSFWKQSSTVPPTTIASSLPALEDLDVYLEEANIKKTEQALDGSKNNNALKPKIRKRKNNGKKKDNR